MEGNDGKSIPLLPNGNLNAFNAKRNKKALLERIPAFGLLMTVLSVIFFSLIAVIVKILTDLHPIEILVIRCIIQLLFSLAVTLIRKQAFFGVRGHRVELLLRCIAGTISLTAIFVAYRMIPIADASTIHFSSPVFVAILAYFLLKEPLTPLQIFTGSITLIGVVIIAKPEFLFGSKNGAEEYHQRVEGTLLAALAAVTAAYSMINLRKLKTTPSAVVIMWYSATIIVSGTIILILLDQLVWPTGLRTWALLLAVGLCGTGDQFFITIALQYESPGPVSVTRTSNIVLSFMWQIVILGEVVEWTSIIGASLISLSVIILTMDKWRHESPKLFHSAYNKFCCCFADRNCHNNNNDDDSDIEYKSITQSFQESYQSVNLVVVQRDDLSHSVMSKT